MNSIQTVGWVWILLEFAEWLTPKEINKASKKIFGVKADRVNIKAVRKAITESKLHQSPERYDFSIKEIVALEDEIQKILNSGKLSDHTEQAIKDGLFALQIMKDALEIHPEDAKIYLREMHGQMQFLVKKGV